MRFVFAFALLYLVGLHVFADETLTRFEEFRVTDYSIRPGDKPIVSNQFGDCALGPISCPLQIMLTDIPHPPGAPGSGNPDAPEVGIDRLGEKQFLVDTDAGLKFKASLRMRRRDSMYSAWLTCTTPDNQMSQSVVTSIGTLESFVFARIACPDYKGVDQHLLKAELLISIKAANDFGFAR